MLSHGALEISGASDGLLDDDLVLRVRGAGPEAEVTWRARFRDDDGRVWRAAASRAGGAHDALGAGEGQRRRRSPRCARCGR